MRKHKHQSDAEPDLVHLNAQHQYRDRRRARDQPSGEAEHNNLAGRHIPGSKPAPDLVGMGHLMAVPGWVMVAMVMMMRVLTRCAAQPQLLGPGPPEHPQGDAIIRTADAI
jgi:hypothetical protein